MKTISIPFSPSAPPLSPLRLAFYSNNSLRFPPKSPALRVSADHYRIEVRRVSYRPPRTQHNLLSEVSFSLPEKSFGLIFGRSGSGKTTLLQLLAGLSKPTSGSINIQRYGNDGNPNGPPETLSPERVGIVFQFPERYFLADTVLEEVTFGWPRQKADLALREQLALKLQFAINSVGLNTISLEEDPHSLSGGFKRRLALAIQLVQMPDLLLLDEPLADWKARADVVKLLKHLKKKLTLLVGTLRSGGSIMEDGNGGDAKGRTPAYMMLQVPFPVSEAT
ncbi:ABC transporter I family member 11, chloroplastic isoform X2 [Elaeis guineensis]|uniref:ABC transporter I family member 11, chloroplastic isoform X2 n=1 Tax=Elaeis guineensis var. tenera TaxID=51953 RepID=A0A6I9QYQ7_ELAGV|nr:ABC transporter I family member 11, chloroplastic isoform X2 [Elaeis guineensis]